MKMKPVTLNREIHKWTGVVLSLFLVIISITGFFLVHKKSLESFREIDVPNALIPDSYGKEMEKHGKEIKTVAVVENAGSAPVLLAGTKGGLRGMAELNSPLAQVEVKALLLMEQRWLAGAKKGLYESLNAGADWSRVERGPFGEMKNLHVEVIEQSPENAAVLWVGAKDGLFRSLDGGASWENMGHLLSLEEKSRHVSTIAFDPSHAGRTLIGTHSGLFSYEAGAEKLLPLDGFAVAATRMRPEMDLHEYLDKLHTGDLFAGDMWLLYDLTAIAMVLFVGTGLYIWIYPTLAKRRKKRSKAALARVRTPKRSAVQTVQSPSEQIKVQSPSLT